MDQTIGRKFGWGLAVAGLAAVALVIIVIVPHRPSAAPDNAMAATGFVIGRVVDPNGKPVAGAQVGTSLQLAATANATVLHLSYADPPVVTGTDGAFRIPARTIAYTRALVARKDGLLGFAIRKEGSPAEIRLAEPAQLDVTAAKDFGTSRLVGADLMSGGSAVGYGSIEGHVSWAVPQGRFEVVLNNPEITEQKSSIAVTGPERQALAVTLQPAGWVRHLGRPAPAITPADLHNAHDVSPAALRGKWVLVDYWATWCVPCVREMPRLIAFYAAHEKDRGRFEIVAIHSPDGKSFAGIKPAYDRLVAKAWNGKGLPFPLVFDPTGETQKRWGVDAYPTTLLIDPQGRLVGAATIDDLARRIG